MSTLKNGGSWWYDKCVSYIPTVAVLFGAKTQQPGIYPQYITKYPLSSSIGMVLLAQVLTEEVCGLITWTTPKISPIRQLIGYNDVQLTSDEIINYWQAKCLSAGKSVALATAAKTHVPNIFPEIIHNHPFASPAEIYGAWHFSEEITCEWLVNNTLIGSFHNDTIKEEL